MRHFCGSDYRPISGLDRYEPDMLDDSEVDAMSETGRRAAEAAMRKRDRDEGRTAGGRMRRGLLYGESTPAGWFTLGNQINACI